MGLQIILGSLGVAVGFYALCKTDHRLREGRRVNAVQAFDNYIIGVLMFVLGGVHALIGVFSLIGP